MKRSRMGMALASAGLLGLSTLTAAAPAFADYGKKLPSTRSSFRPTSVANTAAAHGSGWN